MVVCLQHTSMKEAKSSRSGKPAPSSLYVGIFLKIKKIIQKNQISSLILEQELIFLTIPQFFFLAECELTMGQFSKPLISKNSKS